MALLLCEEMRRGRMALGRVAVSHQQGGTRLHGPQPGLLPAPATCTTPCFLPSNVDLIPDHFTAGLIHPHPEAAGPRDLPGCEGRGTVFIPIFRAFIPILSSKNEFSDLPKVYKASFYKLNGLSFSW